MDKWIGAAGVCINENQELLMVFQGRPEEMKSWSVPSGGKEKNETLEQCCSREIEEETGYIVEIIEPIRVKHGIDENFNISVEVHYFFVKKIGGERKIQDPDQLIYDIAWQSIEELKSLQLSFPEDREFLLNCLKNVDLKGALSI